ncbi:MAG: alpha-amylase family protein [Candidatus Latescibacterota bacterium]
MKRSTFLITMANLMVFTGLSGTGFTENKKYPKRLRRAESFLGIHFDFHAGDDCTEIGKNVDREMVEYIIDKVKPDYIQCDCKGHRGLSSYPTRVGNQAPGFVKDPLKIWREVTAERGIALYMHYSGVWDTEAVKKHPEWARTKENGEKDDRLTSVFGPYVDELMIPQLKELSDVYGVDGVWVDGECWAVDRDYNPAVIEAFRKKTGIAEVPKKPEDPYWYEWSEYNRQGFRDYVNHYVTEMHKHNSDFQLTSNWIYSSETPEPPTVPVDYCSGDYAFMNNLNGIRLDGRCWNAQEKPWDLMAWSFAGNAQKKSAAQLKQEAAAVIALGGGFEVYFNQKRDGSIKKWQMDIMSEVGKFCRERQEFCFRAKTVPQVGLLHYSDAYYRKIKIMFGTWFPKELDSFNGILQCLLDSQIVTDIVFEHTLKINIKDYPLIVFPEWEFITPQFKSFLLDYVRNGGNLLIIGPKAASLFSDVLGVKFEGEAKMKLNNLECNNLLDGFESVSQKIITKNSAKPFGRYFENDDFAAPNSPAGTVATVGKGKIAAIYLDLGEVYYNNLSFIIRDYLNSMIRELFPNPVVQVYGSHNVDVVLTKIKEKLAVNLVNTTSEHINGKVYFYDDIPPIGEMKVSIVYDKKPAKVSLEPGAKKLDFTYSGGRIHLTLPRLDIHNVIMID